MARNQAQSQKGRGIRGFIGSVLPPCWIESTGKKPPNNTSGWKDQKSLVAILNAVASIRWRKLPTDLPRKRHDTPGTSRAFFWLTFAAMVVLGAMNLAMIAKAEAQVQQWAAAPSVKYDTTGSPYSQFHVEEAIEEAIWAWESRIHGMDINYVGLTLAPVERAVITYRWSGLQDYLDVGGSLMSQGLERTWSYLDSGLIAQSVIYLNTAHFKDGIDDCQMMVFSHEFGHALGLNGHSPNKDDLMYYAPAHCRYLPTDNDLVVLGYKPATCHSVLTRELDIYVPDLNAMLERQGGNVWRLSHMDDNPHEQGCNRATMSENGVITLRDVRGRESVYNTVILAPVADDTWSLQWAE